MDIIAIIGTFFSMWGVGISLTRKNNKVKFRFYKKKGIELKESKQLGKAMLWYRKAIDYAESEKQESEIWALIMHIHTDRLIGASQEWKNCTGQTPDWKFGANYIPSNYEKPPKAELLR